MADCKRRSLSSINLRRGPTKNTSRVLYLLLYDVTANAEMYLPSRCLEVCCITPPFYCFERVLLSKCCSCGSAVLAWSKYATICRCEAFTAFKITNVVLGHQSCQLVKKISTFQETSGSDNGDRVPEASVICRQLSRLVTREEIY
jgi:hypothetical protein